jgi:hypothetical protein
MKQKVLIIVGCLLALTLFSVNGYADGGRGDYKVTVTNMTSGQTFTQIIVLNHKKGVSLFTPGSPASTSLATLAESGNTGPLAMMMSMNPKVADIVTTDGPLGPGPGETATIMLEATRGFHYISLAAMMIPTNDGFIALNGVMAPRKHKSVMYLSPGYDAGSEVNDELCTSIPGPFCGGAGLSAENGEGYVHINDGIHGIEDVPEDRFDWRNPVARVVIERVNHDDDDDYSDSDDD